MWCLGPQVKIIFWQKDPAPVFGNKWIPMAQFPAWLIDLQPRSTSQPDTRNRGVSKLLEELFKTGNDMAARGKEFIN